MPLRKRPPKPKATLAPGAEFNFRRFRPGDLIAISLAEIRREDRSRHLLQIVSAIDRAALRAGLDWSMTRDDDSAELRIRFRGR
jgi:hypothetical protein